MIRILIVDDSTAIRDALSSLLNAENGFEVVGIAADGLEAVERAGELLPDVVLMDAQMPKKDGLSATREIREAEGSGARSLIVGMLASDRGALEDACRRAGMDEVLSKPVTLLVSEEAVERIFDGRDPIGKPVSAAGPGREFYRV